MPSLTASNSYLRFSRAESEHDGRTYYSDRRSVQGVSSGSDLPCRAQQTKLFAIGVLIDRVYLFSIFYVFVRSH